MDNQEIVQTARRPAALSAPAIHEDNSWRARAVAAGIAVLALVAAVAGSFVTGNNLSGLTGSVELLSANATTFLSGITNILPLGYAFGAGMAAAVNPCGFAMLPAYLGLYLGTNESVPTADYANRRMRQAYLVSLLVTTGFVLLFGVVGLLISAGARVLIGVFPWIGLVIGVLLVGVGGWVLAGGGLYTSLGDRLAARVGNARQTNAKGYFLFGITYATASLSCTLPIFLVVVGSSVAAGSLLGAVSQFVLYALGMGLVILALTVSITLFEGAMVGMLRKALPHMRAAGALLLILAGAFIVYYWLTLGGLLATFV
jgi:cytochrome c biogenesis protein CcdA